MVMVGVHELQSIEILAFVHSRSKMPLFAAVSLHRPTAARIQPSRRQRRFVASRAQTRGARLTFAVVPTVEAHGTPCQYLRRYYDRGRWCDGAAQNLLDLLRHVVLARAAEPAVAEERVRAANEKEVGDVLDGRGQRDEPFPVDRSTWPRSRLCQKVETGRRNEKRTVVHHPPLQLPGEKA